MPDAQSSHDSPKHAQRRIDDEAFPVRVKLLAPEGGFERQLTDLYAWLDREVGRGDYAFHAASSLGIARDAVAVYFRAPEIAHRFVETCAYRRAVGPPLSSLSRSWAASSTGCWSSWRAYG